MIENRLDEGEKIISKLTNVTEEKKFKPYIIDLNFDDVKLPPTIKPSVNLKKFNGEKFRCII